MGPRSGRAAGYCAGFDAHGYASLGLGRGWGRGFGRGGGGRGRGFGGRWRRFGWYGPPGWTPWEAAGGVDTGLERRVLKSQADALRVRLQALESRLAESEAKEKKEKPE
jgi:hypothetical protein